MYSLRTYGHNFSTSIDHAYINHHDGESSAIPKLISRISTNNLKRSVSSKALLILITIFLIAIAGFILSNQKASKNNSINQLNATPVAKKVAGASSTSTQTPKLQGTVNNTSATSTASSNNSTTVDVNGQTVTVPANSNYSQTTSSGSSTSSVTVSNHSSSTGSSASNTSATSVNVNSH